MCVSSIRGVKTALDGSWSHLLLAETCEGEHPVLETEEMYRLSVVSLCRGSTDSSHSVGNVCETVAAEPEDSGTDCLKDLLSWGKSVCFITKLPLNLSHIFPPECQNLFPCFLGGSSGGLDQVQAGRRFFHRGFCRAAGGPSRGGGGWTAEAGGRDAAATAVAGRLDRW